MTTSADTARPFTPVSRESSEGVPGPDELLWAAPPSSPMLLPNDIHLWVTPLRVSPDTVRSLEALLSPEEINRAQRFSRESDRRGFVVAHGVLRRVLAIYRRTDPRILRFTVSDNGKPALSDETGRPTSLRFSLSHTAELALIGCALRREIGVDIERVRPIAELDSIVEQYFTCSEREALRVMTTAARTDSFYRCWTRKEAYAKASGHSLSEVVRGIDTLPTPEEESGSCTGDARATLGWNFLEVVPASGYVGAVAVMGTVGQLSTWRWTDGADRQTEF